MIKTITSQNPIQHADAIDGMDVSWSQIGENVSAALGITRRGEREKVVSAFAFSYGTYDNRIRKSVAAYEYVAGIEDKRLRKALLAKDLSLVDLISLWASHDSDAALIAARELIEGKHTFRTLLEAERRARPKTRSTVASRSASWREAATVVLLSGKARGYRSGPTPPGLSEAPFDLWFRKREASIGVRLLGPYPNNRDYNRNMANLIFASLGLASIGHTSWIVMPVETAANRYREYAERIAPGVLTIVEIELPPYAAL